MSTPQVKVGDTVRHRTRAGRTRLLYVDKIEPIDDALMLLGRLPYTDPRYEGSFRGSGWAWAADVTEIIPATTEADQ